MFLDNLINRAESWKTRLQRKALELRFKTARKLLILAYIEVKAIHPVGEKIPNQELNVRNDIKAALRDLQVYRHHLGLVTDEQLSTEIKAAYRATAAA